MQPRAWYNVFVERIVTVHCKADLVQGGEAGPHAHQGLAHLRAEQHDGSVQHLHQKSVKSGQISAFIFDPIMIYFTSHSVGMDLDNNFLPAL